MIIPEENRKDIKDIPEKIRKAITIVTVEHVDEVLDLALQHGGELWKGNVSKKMDEAARPPLDPEKAPPRA